MARLLYQMTEEELKPIRDEIRTVTAKELKVFIAILRRKGILTQDDIDEMKRAVD